MKAYITQWVGVHDQFRIVVDIDTAIKYLQSMHRGCTHGTIRFCAKYASAPDDCLGNSYDENTHRNIYCKGNDVEPIIECLKEVKVQSLFKDNLFIIHDIELEDIPNA